MLIKDDANPIVLYRVQLSTSSGTTLFEGPSMLADHVDRPISGDNVDIGCQLVESSSIVGSEGSAGTSSLTSLL